MVVGLDNRTAGPWAREINMSQKAAARSALFAVACLLPSLILARAASAQGANSLAQRSTGRITQASTIQWSKDDLFVGAGDGTYTVLSPTGSVKQTLDT